VVWLIGCVFQSKCRALLWERRFLGEDPGKGGKVTVIKLKCGTHPDFPPLAGLIFSTETPQREKGFQLWNLLFY